MLEGEIFRRTKLDKSGPGGATASRSARPPQRRADATVTRHVDVLRDEKSDRSSTISLFSWNVNGIRSLIKKDLLNPFLEKYSPDILLASVGIFNDKSFPAIRYLLSLILVCIRF